MVHGPLSTHVRGSEARTHVPPTVESLLARGEFVDVHASQRGELGISMSNGDRLVIRTIGFFSVRVYLPRRARRALVWVGLYDGKGVKWKAPTPHRDNYLAALDAYKLVKSLTFERVAGD